MYLQASSPASGKRLNRAQTSVHFVHFRLNQAFSIQQFDLLFKTGLSPPFFPPPFSLSFFSIWCPGSRHKHIILWLLTYCCLDTCCTVCMFWKSGSNGWVAERSPACALTVCALCTAPWSTYSGQLSFGFRMATPGHTDAGLFVACAKGAGVPKTTRLHICDHGSLRGDQTFALRSLNNPPL